MTKSWRPDDWNRVKKEYLVGGEPDWERMYDDDYTAGFECGADAMLESLWKLARESPTGTFTLDSNIQYIYDGSND